MISMRVLIFFATNPDEQLTFSDVVTKFGAKRETAWHVMRPLISRGYVEQIPHPTDKRAHLLVAGPALKKEIGWIS